MSEYPRKENGPKCNVLFFISAGKISYTDIIVFVQVLLPQPLQSAQPAQIELELVSKSIES